MEHFVFLGDDGKARVTYQPGESITLLLLGLRPHRLEAHISPCEPLNKQFLTPFQVSYTNTVNPSAAKAIKAP